MTKNSSIAGRRRNRIAGQFTALLTDMLESPAWRVLSLSAHRVLDRVAIELRHHGGHDGDGLCVTYADFEEYGIERHAIAPAIREAVALGFLSIAQQGRAGNAEFRRPTLYKLTFVNSVDGEPTHEWKRIRSLDEAEMKARAARAVQQPKNRKPVRVSPPTSVRVSRTENGDFPVRVSRTTAVGEPPSEGSDSATRVYKDDLDRACEGFREIRRASPLYDPRFPEPDYGPQGQSSI